MIELEQLNDQSYEEMMEAARRKIGLLTEEWTNHQEYDPGITIMELFGWLTAVQRNYLNEVSIDSKKKFLDLLGIGAQHNLPSHTLLELKTDSEAKRIPASTKFRGAGRVFENKTPQWISSASVTAFHRWDGEVVPIETLSEHHVFSLFGEEPQKDQWFILEFEKPLPCGKPYTFHFTQYLEPHYHRTPIKPGQQFIPMAQLNWEFFHDNVWKPLKILRDDTQEFLFSGIISILLEEEASIPVNKIRVTLESAEYDLPPRVCGVRSNVLEVEQRDSLCCSEILTTAQLRNGEAFLQSELALYGQNVAYQRINGAWYPCEAVYKPLPLEGRTQVEVPFEPKGPDAEPALLVVSLDARGVQMHLLASGTKISNQIIALSPKNILYDAVDLMVGERDPSGIGYTIWEKTEDFYCCDKDSRAYILDCVERKVRFGDHEFGMVPPKGQENIRLIGLALTEGRGSNIQKGIIRTADRLENVSIVQFAEARGGRNEETFEERMKRCADLFGDCKRTVTVKDYETIVRQTPGLLLRDVKILQGYATKEHNTLVPQRGAVTIAAYGEGRASNAPLKSYVDNIRLFMEKHRLVNTNMMVCWPSYIGLHITGKIIITFRGKQNERSIEQAVETFVKRLSDKMGTPLYYGDLFGILDTLDDVSYVESLQLLATGTVMPRGVTDDVFIPENGVYYVKKIEFDYIRSENF